MTMYSLMDVATGECLGYVCAYSDEEAMTEAEKRGFQPLQVLERNEDPSSGQYCGNPVLVVA